MPVTDTAYKRRVYLTIIIMFTLYSAISRVDSVVKHLNKLIKTNKI